MRKYIQLTTLGLGVFAISSCVVLENSTSDNLYYPAYNNNQLYPKSNYLNNMNYKEQYYYQNNKQEVTVPDSYHISSASSPVSFRDRDHSWVNSQSPQAYTIEVANGNNAAQVAQVLYTSPKTDRRAQVKYQRDGKQYYRGVYGSYPNATEAQKALNNLPADIRGGASVVKWESVQGCSNCH